MYVYMYTNMYVLKQKGKSQFWGLLHYLEEKKLFHD